MSQTKTKFKSFSELGKHFGLPSIEKEPSKKLPETPSEVQNWISKK